MIEEQKTNLLRDINKYDYEIGRTYRFIIWQEFKLTEDTYPTFWRRVFNRPVKEEQPYKIRVGFDVFITGHEHEFIKTGLTTTDEVEITVSPNTDFDEVPGAILSM